MPWAPAERGANQASVPLCMEKKKSKLITEENKAYINYKELKVVTGINSLYYVNRSVILEVRLSAFSVRKELDFHIILLFARKLCFEWLRNVVNAI
jgi:hypothetical protein